MVHLHVQFHHLVHIERLHASSDGRTKRVAQKIHRVMVFEKLRIVLENRTLLGFLNIHLHAQQSLFAYLIQKLVHHLERAQIALLGEWRTLHHARKSGGHTLNNVHRVGHQQRARGRAGDDQQLGWLHEHRHVPLLHKEAANNRCKHQDNTYDGKHSCLPDADVMQLPPA